MTYSHNYVIINNLLNLFHRIWRVLSNGGENQQNHIYNMIVMIFCFRLHQQMLESLIKIFNLLESLTYFITQAFINILLCTFKLNNFISVRLCNKSIRIPV